MNYELDVRPCPTSLLEDLERTATRDGTNKGITDLLRSNGGAATVGIHAICYRRGTTRRCCALKFSMIQKIFHY